MFYQTVLIYKWPRALSALSALMVMVAIAAASLAWGQDGQSPTVFRGEDDATGTPVFIREGAGAPAPPPPPASGDQRDAPPPPNPDLATDPILLNILRGNGGALFSNDDASFRSMDNLLRDWLTTDTLIGGFEGSWTARVAIESDRATSPALAGDQPRVRVGDDSTFPDFTFDAVRILPGPTPPPAPTPELTPPPDPTPTPEPDEGDEPQESAPPDDEETAPPAPEDEAPTAAEATDGEQEDAAEAPAEDDAPPPSDDEPPPSEEAPQEPAEDAPPPEDRGEEEPGEGDEEPPPPPGEEILPEEAYDLLPNEEDVIRAQADLRMISIEALVVEINKSYTRTLGIRHSAMRRDDLLYPKDVVRGVDLYVPAAFSDVSIPNYSQDRNSFELSNSRINRAPGLGLNFVGTDLRPGQLTIRLRMLLSEGKATVRTRPIISTLNKTVATMTIGDQIPYQTYRYQPDGKVLHNIERKNVGINFTVQPTIVNLERDLLELHIHQIRVSSIANMVTVNQITFPNLASSENSTRVVLKSGETLIIGGLQYDKTVVNMNRVPILGAIPILGMLFRQKETVVEARDILFFVTPKILEPRESLALPFDFKNNVPIAIRHK